MIQSANSRNLAIVTPALNEVSTIKSWLMTLDQELEWINQNITPTKFTIVVVDDGSTDNTFQEVERARVDLKSNLMVLRFSRNFGHQAALIAGMKSVMQSVDAVVTMDSDGEHPPVIIRDLVKEWLQGHLIVHTVRKEHKNLPILKRLFSKTFYTVVRMLSGLPIRSGMADFKLWDGQLLRALASYLDTSGPTRLLAVYMSPKSAQIEFDQVLIPGRVSRFTFRKNITLAVQSIIFYSEKPLKWIGRVGAVICLSALLFVTQYTVASLAFFVLGLNLVALYILCEYFLQFQVRKALPQYAIIEQNGSWIHSTKKQDTGS